MTQSQQSKPATEKAQRLYRGFTKKGQDYPAMLLMALAAAAVVYAVFNRDRFREFFDLSALLLVLGGTGCALILQFNLRQLLQSIQMLAASFWSTPDKNLRNLMIRLDDAILNDMGIHEMGFGDGLSGDYLNDALYMKDQRLLPEEIMGLLQARVQRAANDRTHCVELLQRGAIIAPALGLFGTVVGLVGVLHNLQDPSQIGPSMALALMTTAYGAFLGTLVLGPLAGRLQHHNDIFARSHQQMLDKMEILLARSERIGDPLSDNHWEEAS